MDSCKDLLKKLMKNSMPVGIVPSNKDTKKHYSTVQPI